MDGTIFENMLTPLEWHQNIVNICTWYIINQQQHIPLKKSKTYKDFLEKFHI